jgi:hypothetical protein
LFKTIFKTHDLQQNLNSRKVRRNAEKSLVGNLKERDYVGDLAVDGKITYMDFKQGTTGLDSSRSGQGRLKFQLQQDAGHFLTK